MSLLKDQVAAGGGVSSVTSPVPGLVDNTNPATPIINGDVFGSAAAAETAAKSYADSLVVGLWDDRGNYDASVNAYPSSGGSGTAGAILKGDIWTISVGGTLPTGQAVVSGDTVRALINTPGNTQANWAIAEANLNPGSVTNSLLAVMPANTIKLNNTGGAASPIDGTVAQLKAMLGYTYDVDYAFAPMDQMSTGVTAYYCPYPGPATDGAESVRQIVCPSTGEIHSLYVQMNSAVGASGGASAVVVTFRLEGVSQSVVVNIPASSPSGTIVADLVNSFAVTAGQRIALQCINASGSTVTFGAFAWKIRKTL